MQPLFVCRKKFRSLLPQDPGAAINPSHQNIGWRTGLINSQILFLPAQIDPRIFPIMKQCALGVGRQRFVHARYTVRAKGKRSAEIPVRNRKCAPWASSTISGTPFHAPELQSLQYRKRHHHRSGKSANSFRVRDTAPACHAPVPVRYFPECQSLSAPDIDMQSSGSIR